MGKPSFEECCGAIHAGRRPAFTAEELMRSRYCAFAVGDVHWLAESWHPDSRPRTIHVVPEDRWLGLTIVATEAGGPLDDEGEVHFVAEVERNGVRRRVEERSAFVRHEGRWVYLHAV